MYGNTKLQNLCAVEAEITVRSQSTECNLQESSFPKTIQFIRQNSPNFGTDSRPDVQRG